MGAYEGRERYISCLSPCLLFRVLLLHEQDKYHHIEEHHPSPKTSYLYSLTLNTPCSSHTQHTFALPHHSESNKQFTILYYYNGFPRKSLHHKHHNASTSSLESSSLPRSTTEPSSSSCAEIGIQRTPTSSTATSHVIYELSRLRILHKVVGYDC
jgi:hypothetical protein